MIADLIVAFGAVASIRIARKSWKSDVNWSDVRINISGQSNEPRLRLSAASLSNAISINSLALSGILALVADEIGRSTTARVILVASALAGISFVLFVALTASIYLRGRPKKLIPPSLRNR